MILFIEREEIFKEESSLFVGSNVGDSEKRIKYFEFGVIGEKNLASEFHLTFFSGCDGGQAAAVLIIFAVFDFGEIEILIKTRNKINFAKLSFVVFEEDFVTFGCEKIGDDLFGLGADFGGIFTNRGSRRDFGKAGETANGAKAETMLRGDAVLLESGEMFFGTIAFVLLERIFGVFFGEINHVVVTSDFGKNGGGGDFFD